MGTNRDDRNPAYAVGQSLVAGGGIGVVAFALTGDALWIVIGTAMGVVVGGVWGAMSGRSGDARHEDGRHD